MTTHRRRIMKYPYLFRFNSADRPPNTARLADEYRRLLQMCGLACGIGVLGALAAFALQAAIVLCTNLFFQGRFSLEPGSPAQHHLGLLVVFIPPLGGLIVGLLARYAAPSIRGHGIPETMETILV